MSLRKSVRKIKAPVEEQMPIPSFQDYVEQKKVVERTPPAALQIFDRMREINPEIDQLPPEQQTELLETIMRQGEIPLMFKQNL